MNNPAVSKKKVPDSAVVSIWMKNEVLACLDERVVALSRSRSWLVNNVMRERLGFPPDDGFKEQTKL